MKNIFIVDNNHLVRERLRRDLSVHDYSTSAFEKESKTVQRLSKRPAHLLINSMFSRTGTA